MNKVFALLTFLCCSGYATAQSLGLMGPGPGAAGGIGDEYYANVSVLLHMDGVNNGTTFTDQKGHTFSALGAAVTSTGVAKFGTASMYNNSTIGTAIQADANTDWELGTGDFTIEFWLNRVADGGVKILLEISDTGNEATGLVIMHNTVGAVIYYQSVTTGFLAGSFAPTAGQWYHIAVSRVSGTTKVFIDGVSVASGSDTNNWGRYKLTIGNRVDGGGLPTPGYIDDLRITKGVGRYSANFTPPTAAFPNF